jgi:hypothetical protein
LLLLLEIVDTVYLQTGLLQCVLGNLSAGSRDADTYTTTRAEVTRDGNQLGLDPRLTQDLFRADSIAGGIDKYNRVLL